MEKPCQSVIGKAAVVLSSTELVCEAGDEVAEGDVIAAVVLEVAPVPDELDVAYESQQD
jgi:hypothetical protein